MWSPRYNRISVELDEESLSSVVHVDTKSSFVRVIIKELGPLVGYDLTQVGWVERPSILSGDEILLEVGEKVLVNRADIITHVGANNEKFLIVGEGQIVARDTIEVDYNVDLEDEENLGI